MMSMTSANSAGEDLIIIHVYDPIAKLDHTFECSKEVLTSRVGYFADQITHDRLTIENCDLCLFDWLIRWANGEEPTFATTNVLRILLLASFLRNGLLVRRCLDFCIEEKVDMSSLSDSELTQLAPHVGASHIEGLEGLNGRKTTGRLFYALLEAWTNGREPLRGNFCDLARLYRCAKCSEIVHRDKPSIPGCVHEEHTAWNVQEYIEGLHKETKAWQKVYWQVWGEVHFCFCPSCQIYVAAQQMAAEQEIDAKHPLGSFSCCGRRVYNRDFLHNVESYASKSVSPSDMCQVLYDTLDTYFSRFTGNKTRANVASEDESETPWPMIDMSKIWKADELSLVQQSINSYSRQICEDFVANSNGDNISCEDASDNEDASLQRERITKWFYGNSIMPVSPEQSVIEEEFKAKNLSSVEVMFKKMCLVGPFGDSTAFPDDQVGMNNSNVDARSETHSGVITDEWMPKKTRNKRSFLTETGNSESIKTREEKCRTEHGSNDGRDLDSMTKSDNAHSIENGFSDRPSDGSERRLSNFGTDDSTASSKSEEEEKVADEEDLDEEPLLLADRRPSQVSYLKLDADVKGQGVNEEYHHWKPCVSHANNQMNQYNYELYKNEEIINYLTSKIYKIPKIKRKITTLSSDEEAARSQWLMNIVPTEGTHSRIEEERTGPQACSNRQESYADYEETNICIDIPCETPNPPGSNE